MSETAAWLEIRAVLDAAVWLTAIIGIAAFGIAYLLFQLMRGRLPGALR